MGHREGGDDLKTKYSARELAREWESLGMEGRGKRLYHQKVIRDLGGLNPPILQHPGANGKGKWFWTADIRRKAPHLYERWLEKRHAAQMAKTARGEAA